MNNADRTQLQRDEASPLERLAADCANARDVERELITTEGLGVMGSAGSYEAACGGGPRTLH